MHLNCPPWLEKILKFTIFKWLEMDFWVQRPQLVATLICQSAITEIIYSISKKSFSRGFLIFFQGYLPIPGVFRGNFRDQFYFRGFSGFFRVSGVDGHPATMVNTWRVVEPILEIRRNSAFEGCIYTKTRYWGVSPLIIHHGSRKVWNLPVSNSIFEGFQGVGFFSRDFKGFFKGSSFSRVFKVSQGFSRGVATLRVCQKKTSPV